MTIPGPRKYKWEPERNEHMIYGAKKKKKKNGNESKGLKRGIPRLSQNETK